MLLQQQRWQMRLWLAVDTVADEAAAALAKKLRRQYFLNDGAAGTAITAAATYSKF